MPLKFPGRWRFKAPANARFANETIPAAAVEECIDLITKVIAQGDRQAGLEHFKARFASASGASYSRSSNAGWAEEDLRRYAVDAAVNAPRFIEALYDSCDSYSNVDPDSWTPELDILNGILAKHRIGYVIRPPWLDPREAGQPMVSLGDPPATLADRAAEILQESLARSEQLLSEGRGREAVQESLWLLETVATAFRGLETTTGTVEGKYFNQIIRELRNVPGSITLKRVLDWVGTLHGYLSSPTGGGVRHGLDLADGIAIGDDEARLFCNLIRSYLSFLLVEHHRLLGEHS